MGVLEKLNKSARAGNSIDSFDDALKSQSNSDNLSNSE